MPVKTHDRPLETVRQQVIDQLIMNYGHGELSEAAFERRLDAAMDASDHETLLELTADLDLSVDKQYSQVKAQELGARISRSPAKPVDYMVHIFGGSDISGPRQLAREIRIIDVFSGCDLDLSESSFPGETMKIRMFSLFSGTDLYVPENINVITRVFCIFGGIDNRVATLTNPDAPTLEITGIAIFSGIDIQVKQTLKERFVRLAEGLKSLVR